MILRCFQKADINNLSRSETIFNGKPFSQYQLSKNRTASCFAVRVIVVGMMRTSEPRRSVIVSLQLKP